LLGKHKIALPLALLATALIVAFLFRQPSHRQRSAELRKDQRLRGRLLALADERGSRKCLAANGIKKSSILGVDG